MNSRCSTSRPRSARPFWARATLLPAIYLLWSLKKGAIAPANPWGAKGLEWEKTQSPPTTFNFEEDVIVTEPAYNYRPATKVHHG